MKRVLESDISPSAASKDDGDGEAARTTSVVNPVHHLLFVLVPEKNESLRETMGIPQDKNIDRCPMVLTYVVGSANAKLKLEEVLLKMVEAHSPFKAHPADTADVDLTSLPVLLEFLADVPSVVRLPRAIARLSPRLATAKRAHFGIWEAEYMDYSGATTFDNGPYKAMYYVVYDCAATDHVIDTEKLDENESCDL